MILDGHIRWPDPELEAAATGLIAWALESMRLSGLRESSVARILGIRPTCAIQRLYTEGDPAVLTLERVFQLGKLSRRDVPKEIIASLVALEQWRATQSYTHPNPPPPDSDAEAKDARTVGRRKRSLDWRARLAALPDDRCVLPGGTVAAELAALIDLAVDLRGGLHPERNRAILRARYGLKGPARTLQAIGSAHGLTRERVRQFGAKLEDVWRTGAGRWQAPALDALRTALPAHSGRPVEAIELALRDVLGDISLRSAITAMEAIWGASVEWKLSHFPQGRRGSGLLLDAEGGGAAQHARDVLVLARKLQRFAGAVSVADLYAATRKVGHGEMSLGGMQEMLEGALQIRWLDEAHRYFMVEGEPETRIARLVKTILAVAENPVQFELVYAGLVRTARRKYVSQAALSTDAVSPAPVIRAALGVEPTVVRGRGDAYHLTPRPHWRELLTGDSLATVGVLHGAGGAMTLWDLKRQLKQGHRNVSRVSLGAILTFAPFIDRIGGCFYALRGREIPAAVLARDSDEVRRRAGKRPSLAATGRFEVQVRNVDYVARNSVVCARGAEVPEGVAGAYRMAATGTTCALVDDKHGVRVRALGLPIKAAIVRAGSGARLIFDVQDRTVALVAPSCVRDSGRSTPVALPLNAERWPAREADDSTAGTGISN